MEFWFIVLMIAGFVIPISVVLTFVHASKISRIENNVRTLNVDLSLLERDVDQHERQLSHIPMTGEWTHAPPSPKPKTQAPPKEAPAERSTQDSAARSEASRAYGEKKSASNNTAAKQPNESAGARAPAAPAGKAPEVSRRKSQKSGSTSPFAGSIQFTEMETDLSSKWMMWIGGIALALGGGFLVKYSIDTGLLSPAVRVGLGILLGLVLTIGGEVVRQKRQGFSWLDGAPDYLPGALSAAGLFTLFASVFSGYALYEFIGPIVAFSTMAIISLAASLLATRQGPFFAYLGLIGGMVVPAMVSLGQPSAWTLFPYLLFITATTLAVARRHAWTAVAIVTLIVSLVWPLFWLIASWQGSDVVPVGLYLLTLQGLSAWLLRGASPERSTDSSAAGILPSHSVSKWSDGVVVACLLLLVSIVRLDHYGAVSMFIFGASVLGQFYALWRNAEHDAGGIASLLATLFLLGTWHLPAIWSWHQPAVAPAAASFPFGPIAPPGFETFITAALLLGSGFGFGIFALLPRLMRKSVWSVAGAAYPIAVLLIAYVRLENFETSFAFAGVALAIAGLATAAVATLNKEGHHLKVAIAAYSTAATAGLTLALAMALRDAWLTFALAMQVVALAHIWTSTRLDGLRTLALWLAGIVLVRLFANVAVFGYDGGGTLPVINWLFYAYGLSSGLFAYAAHLFGRSDQDDRLVSVLKAGSVFMLVAFTTLEIRVLAGKTGGLAGDMTALEIALQTINWTAAATILLWREIRDDNRLFGKLRKAMTLLSIGSILIGGGLLNNILFSQIDVGSWPLLNLYFLQFFVPGLLYAVKTWLAYRAGKQSHTLYGAVAALTFLLWLTLEVRHAFHPYGSAGTTSDWEWYAYSLAWLLYAACLLFGGIRFGLRAARMAGLGLLGLVVLKVFVFDMSHLEGIARALSFMGLGVALIGLGYLYQMFGRREPLSTDGPGTIT